MDTSVNIGGLEHYLGEWVLASTPALTPVTRWLYSRLVLKSAEGHGLGAQWSQG